MRHLLRAAVAGAALLAATAPPADAAGAVVLTCTVRYTLGASGTGSGECRVTGTVNGTVYVDSPAAVSFSVVPGGLPRCLNDIGFGTMSGALAGTFNWTRLGTAGVFTFVTGTPLTGPATFVERSATHDDESLSCGFPTSQSITAVLAGT